VFVLFELEGFTLTEISELLAIPRGTAASRLRRGRDEFMRAAKRMRGRGAP
jgi:RNA polymerase sigma-70 factor (ECF subfamily)